MKKIKLNLSLDGRHGITSLPWEGWEYPEMPGLEGIRLCAIRIPIVDYDAYEGNGFKPDTQDWKLIEVTTTMHFLDIGIKAWPTMPRLIEKALPALIVHAEAIREKVKEHHGDRKS